MSNAMKQNHGIITLKSCLLGAVLLGLVSCASSKEATQKEEALKRWDDARSGVLVGLATDQYDHGNLDRSRATIDEAINLSPDSAVAHLLSAKLYIEAGQLEVAERELVLVHQDDPNDVQAYYLSGIIFRCWQQPERRPGVLSTRMRRSPGGIGVRPRQGRDARRHGSPARSAGLAAVENRLF